MQTTKGWKVASLDELFWKFQWVHKMALLLVLSERGICPWADLPEAANCHEKLPEENAQREISEMSLFPTACPVHSLPGEDF